MAYTIAFLDGPRDVQRTLLRLSTTIHESGMFKAQLEIGKVRHHGEDLVCIDVSLVRLTKAKPYCGQHPGECLVGGPRRKSTYLEWDDWVIFNGLVNDILDQHNVNADVWSMPPEALSHGKKMWIRRGTKRRYHYDWEERTASYGRPIRIWNHGTEDQFVEERP